MIPAESQTQQKTSFSHRSFSLRDTPSNYLKSIFNILSLQLFFLVICLILSGKYINIRRFFIRHTILFVFMIIITILSAASLRTGVFYKQYPTNYTVLVVFNLAFNYTVCRISYMFTPLAMLTFCVLYLSVITGLTLYVSNVDKQVNFKNALMTCGISILMGGILMLVFYEITFIKFLICGVLAVFASAYLIYATILIFELKRKSIKMDDETMGVISYYCDFFSVGKHLFQSDYSQEVRL